MLTDEQYNRALKALPMLALADPDQARDFRERAFFARIPQGRDVFVEGDQVEAIALLISGAVRVYKIGETGREITLYRFGNGESCILSANAILSSETFDAIATVDEEAEAIMIPAETFREWVRQHDIWRDFLFDLLSQRLAAVMSIVGEVAFGRMDSRLATLLIDRAAGENPIRTTHQEIAAELGSSREVISRLLEDLSSAGLIRTGRGRIEVLDGDSLRQRSLM
jgi:CRP/FNR family transcriptional regulator